MIIYFLARQSYGAYLKDTNKKQGRIEHAGGLFCVSATSALMLECSLSSVIIDKENY